MTTHLVAKNNEILLPYHSEGVKSEIILTEQKLRRRQSRFPLEALRRVCLPVSCSLWRPHVSPDSRSLPHFPLISASVTTVPVRPLLLWAVLL